MTDITIRTAAPRSGSESIRVSVPADIAGEIGVSPGDQIALIATDDGVRLVPASSLISSDGE